MGDLNLDILDSSKRKPLQDINDLFDLKCQGPKMLHKLCKPSLLVVILTNKNQSFMKTCQYDTGLSVWHNMIFIVLKGNLLPFKNSQFEKTSFKGLIGMCSIKISSGFPGMCPLSWMTLMMYIGCMTVYSMGALMSTSYSSLKSEVRIVPLS